MSEYQSYTFLAIDRPLSSEDQAALRKISTRATISSRRFFNFYTFGAFKGNSLELLQDYFDIFQYNSDLDHREIHLRFPSSSVDLRTWRTYLPPSSLQKLINSSFQLQRSEHFVILSFSFIKEDLGEEEDYEEDYDYGYDDEGYDDEADERGFYEGSDPGDAHAESLPALREGLLSGDLRPLYLFWLAFVSQLSPDASFATLFEPPVPPGLQTLSRELEALCRFCCLNPFLLQAAQEASLPLAPAQGPPPPEKIAAFLQGLPAQDKDSWLLRLLQGETVSLRREILQCLQPPQALPTAPRRSLADLFQRAKALKEEHQRLEEQRLQDELRRQEEAAAQARDIRLAAIAKNKEKAWREADDLAERKTPSDYKTAVALISDLHALAQREADLQNFLEIFEAFCIKHKRKKTFIERLSPLILTTKAKT